VTKGALLRVLGIALVVAAICTAIALFVPWLPDADSKQADRIDWIFWFVTAICIGVFALVTGIFVYSLVAFRARPDDDTDGAPVHGHTGLEITWTAVPFVLVTAIGIVSAIALAKNEDVPKDHLRVKVLAQQFTWSFEYPQYNNVATTTLRLPVDRTVELEMTARDVIHSFYVPEFRQKEDILPGEVRNLVITPTKTGRYVIQCAELCGLGHAAMLGRVIVMTKADFQTWAGHAGAASGGPGADPGKAVFANNGCGSCHTYAPAGSTGKVGPDLDKLPEYAKQAKRPLEDFTRDSIVNPSGYIQPGYPNVMPPFSSLPEEQLNALVAFLTPDAKS
jgi:cytochrome c oxidase subunit II